MPDQNFGSLTAFSDVEDAVLLHYKLWMHAWLSARERKLLLPVNTIARPRSYLVKQTFTALPGEEQTPIVIAVCDGFAREPERRGSGVYDAYLRFGIAVMCMGNSARALCGHYQAAVLGIAVHHRAIAGGLASLDDFSDLHIDNVEEEAVGRVIAAVRMELVYKVPEFANENPALVIVPPDPEEPQPDDPEVETVTVLTNNYQVDEEIPSG
jgi:hypothetical protein